MHNQYQYPIIYQCSVIYMNIYYSDIIILLWCNMYVYTRNDFMKWRLLIISYVTTSRLF